MWYLECGVINTNLEVPSYDRISTMVCVGFDPWWTQWMVTAGAKYRSKIHSRNSWRLGLVNYFDIYFIFDVAASQRCPSRLFGGIDRIVFSNFTEYFFGVYSRV